MLDKKGKLLLGGAIGVLFTFSLLGAWTYMGSSVSKPKGKVVSKGPIHYNAQVCVFKNGEKIGCSHNTLTNDGKNITRDILGQGATPGAFSYIAVSNSTSAADADGTLEPTIQLGPTSGTFTATGTGKWQINNTWTVGASYTGLQLSGLFNGTDTVNDIELAENSFTPTDLQPNDKLTLSWQLNVTGA